MAAALTVAGWLAPQAYAFAGPRDDLANAYIQAADQLNNLELEAAQVTLDDAVSQALAAGMGDDPSLAKVYAMRTGIIFANTQDRGLALQSCLEAVQLDYNVKLPIELASPDLTAICDEARAGVARPTDAIVHTPPPGTPNNDIEFIALANTNLPLGSSIVLYWRTAGTEAEYKGEEMVGDGEGNWGAFSIPAEAHGGKNIEYFFYAFDPSNQQLANRGDKRNPMLLEMDENAVAPVVASGDDTDGKEDEGTEDDGEEKPRRKDRKKASGLPRVFINLGFGTGFGIARGNAELTYEQYTPGLPSAVYAQREQACAVERWFAAGSELAPDAATFEQHLRTIQSAGSQILPFDSSEDGSFSSFAANYDPSYCNRRHPVSTGLALAPFHIAPEIGVRVARALVVSVYARLQVVTGSRVFTDDTGKQLQESYNLDVRSQQPAGFRQRPPFTWAIGAKVKYFFGKDERKFRLFAGGFVGYGSARLRVPMNFSNDRNGNSVPDAAETALHGPLDSAGAVDPDQCTVVWPYNQGCAGSDEGMTDRQLAQSVRGATAGTDERVDTVVIGPAFVGALFGFNYQVHKNFSIFAEVDAGGWFPSTTSMLFDITVGPAITF